MNHLYDFEYLRFLYNRKYFLIYIPLYIPFAGDPTTFVSHLPIYQDGSCNGLQHYAALGRDEEGGKEVNLVPAEKPSDVYSSVAFRYVIIVI